MDREYRLSYTASEIDKKLGKIDKIDRIDSIPSIEKGVSRNTMQQNGNTAGARAYKIVDTQSTEESGYGKYILRTIDGIVTGMRYASCTSEMNAIGGTIIDVDASENTVTVDKYVNVPLNGKEDNVNTGDVYDYLIIVDHPELGDIEIGYGGVSFGCDSAVYAKNGFASAKNGKVLGKYGKVGGIDTKAGHAARADGNNTRALAPCSSTDGTDTEATGFASHADGVGTRAKEWGQHTVGRYNKNDSSHDMFIVGAGNSDADRRNCFTTGFDPDTNNGGSYIKVGTEILKASKINAMKNGIFGTGTISEGTDHQMVCGEYNQKNWDARFIVGRGTESQRLNCFAAGVKDGASVIWVGSNMLTAGQVGTLANMANNSSSYAKKADIEKSYVKKTDIPDVKADISKDIQALTFQNVYDTVITPYAEGGTYRGEETSYEQAYAYPQQGAFFEANANKFFDINFKNLGDNDCKRELTINNYCESLKLYVYVKISCKVVSDYITGFEENQKILVEPNSKSIVSFDASTVATDGVYHSTFEWTVDGLYFKFEVDK